jgi:hypothetical protein
LLPYNERQEEEYWKHLATHRDHRTPKKKAPKPTTHHESQKELWNDSTTHPNHGNLGNPEMLPTHDEGQEECWNQLAIRPNHGNLGGLEIMYT